MAAPDASPRVLGVALPDVSDWAEPLPAGKWSQFFRALADRTPLVDVARPTIPALSRYLSLARRFHPDRATWLARAGFDMGQVAMLNASLARQLEAHRGGYDLVVQLQTLCSPLGPSLDSPYVVYTDNTMALTQRIYPRFAPLGPAALARWQDFEAEVCNGARRVFTFSEFARRSIVDDYGCRPDQVRAIGAGANQLLLSLEGKDYSGARALFVGHPFELKGGRILLEAWRSVHRQLPDAELLLVGPKRDPAPGFGHGVRWLGWIGRDELARQYSSATVFVLPSMFDAWGHVFVEAMGHGLPCIGNDVCAMPELISDGRTGRLVPRGRPGPLAEALVELLSDPAKAARMGAAGHARVLSELTWPRVIERLLTGLVPGGEEPSAARGA